MLMKFYDAITRPQRVNIHCVMVTQPNPILGEILLTLIVKIVLKKLEWAASNGNRYPPYPQVMATAISQ